VLKQYHAGATMQTTAYDRTGATKLAVGKLDTIDNQIDPTTGTVKLRALFDNPDESLFPNQFVNIKLLVNTLQNIVLIPNSAIQRGAPGTFVYLVKPNHTVGVQKVKLGPADAQNIAIRSGLKAGDQVVDDGADRLKDGAKITVAPPPGSAGQAAAAQTAGTPYSGHRRHQRGGASPTSQ
jgi:multidrug efflux system membrane fusion protein